MQTIHPLTFRSLAKAFFFLLIWTSSVAAHDVYLPVIVDTDGAADDIRAIAT